jgi:hypothetical protein
MESIDQISNCEPIQNGSENVYQKLWLVAKN